MKPKFKQALKRGLSLVLSSLLIGGTGFNQNLVLASGSTPVKGSFAAENKSKQFLINGNKNSSLFFSSTNEYSFGFKVTGSLNDSSLNSNQKPELVLEEISNNDSLFTEYLEEHKNQEENLSTVKVLHTFKPHVLIDDKEIPLDNLEKEAYITLYNLNVADSGEYKEIEALEENNGVVSLKDQIVLSDSTGSIKKLNFGQLSTNSVIAIAEVTSANVNPLYTIQTFINFTGVDWDATTPTSGSKEINFINTESIDYEAYEGGALDPSNYNQGGNQPVNGSTNTPVKGIYAPQVSSETINLGGSLGSVQDVYYGLPTTTSLKPLFIDEQTDYISNPQIHYMSRLYSSTESYNENYTLTQIWVYDPQFSSVLNSGNTVSSENGYTVTTDLKSSDFLVFPVPPMQEEPGYEGPIRHEPEKIRFTNNPNNCYLTFENSAALQQAIENGKVTYQYTQSPEGAINNFGQYIVTTAAQKDCPDYNYDFTILISPESVIRLVYEPIESNFDVDQAAQGSSNPGGVTVETTFFDYDISDGYAYTNQPTFDGITKNPNAVYVPTSEQANNVEQFVQSQADLGLNQSELKFAADDNNQNFVTAAEGNRRILNHYWAWTTEQGINNPANYPGGSYSSNSVYAFGNDNTGTHLGQRTYDGYKMNANPLVGDINPSPFESYYHGCTFNLVSNEGLKYEYVANEEDDVSYLPTPIFNTGISAPDIFGTSQLTGKTIYSSNTSIATPNRNNGTQQVTGSNGQFYKLNFDQIGGTYTLNSVSKFGPSGLIREQGTYNLKYFEALNSVWNNDQYITNQFWPMDNANSTASDGHDIAFGNIGLFNKWNGGNSFVWNGDNTDEDFSRDSAFSSYEGPGATGTDSNYTFNKNRGLPISDDLANHNSFFGMSYSVEFTIKPGYIAPLEYWFYGDDDMWVYLDEVDDDPSNARLIADIGGVHSSIGTFTNLWDYIDPIPYDGVAQKYRLTVFYTERGASGSSCYMRFTLPLEDDTIPSPLRNDDLAVQKVLLDPSGEEVEYSGNNQEQFQFEIQMSSEDGTPYRDLYGYEIRNSETGEIITSLTALDNSFECVNGCPSGTSAPQPYTFSLYPGTYAVFPDLPENTNFQVSEIGVNGDEYITRIRTGTFNNAYDPGINPGLNQQRPLFSQSDITDSSPSFTMDAQEHTSVNYTTASLSSSLYNFVQFTNGPAIKVETEPGENAFVDIGEEITYEIDWAATDLNDDDTISSAIITDHLDPGLSFVSASFISYVDGEKEYLYTLSLDGEETYSPGQTITESGSGYSISYTFPKSNPGTEGYDPSDPDYHYVEWKVTNAEPITTVSLTAKVNDQANIAYEYDESTGTIQSIPGQNSDLKVINMASVTVGDNETIFTNVIENTLTLSKKTETKITKTNEEGQPISGSQIGVLENINLLPNKNKTLYKGPNVEIGDIITYRIYWSNGTDNEVQMIVGDILDPGLTYIDGSATSYLITNNENPDQLNSESTPAFNLNVNSIELSGYEQEDVSTTELIWIMSEVSGLQSGYVEFNAQVNPMAFQIWEYPFAGEDFEYPFFKEGTDIDVYNRGYVILNDSGTDYEPGQENSDLVKVPTNIIQNKISGALDESGTLLVSKEMLTSSETTTPFNFSLQLDNEDDELPGAFRVNGYVFKTPSNPNDIPYVFEATQNQSLSVQLEQSFENQLGNYISVYSSEISEQNPIIYKATVSNSSLATQSYQLTNDLPDGLIPIESDDYSSFDTTISGSLPSGGSETYYFAAYLDDIQEIQFISDYINISYNGSRITGNSNSVTAIVDPIGEYVWDFPTADGEYLAKFSLLMDQSVLITGLPIGAGYEITEIDVDPVSVTYTPESQTILSPGTTEPGLSASVVVVNSDEPGISIQKPTKSEEYPGNNHLVSTNTANKNNVIYYNISYTNENNYPYVLIYDPLDPGLDFISANVGGFNSNLLPVNPELVLVNGGENIFTNKASNIYVQYFSQGSSVPETINMPNGTGIVTINFEKWMESQTPQGIINYKNNNGFLLWFIGNPVTGNQVGTVGLSCQVTDTALKNMEVWNQAIVQWGDNPDDPVMETEPTQNPLQTPLDKEEITPGDGELVELGDTISYNVPYFTETNVSSTVVVLDPLDPGLDFVGAYLSPVTNQGIEPVITSADPFYIDETNGVNVFYVENNTELENQLSSINEAFNLDLDLSDFDIQNMTVNNGWVVWVLPNTQTNGEEQYLGLTVQVNASAIGIVKNQSVCFENENYHDSSIPTNPLPGQHKAEIYPGDGVTVSNNQEITYNIYYNNGDTTGDIVIADYLDEYVDFVSASDDGVYYPSALSGIVQNLIDGLPEIENFDHNNGIVIWNLTNVSSNQTGYVSLTVKVDTSNFITHEDLQVDNQAGVSVGGKWYPTEQPENPLNSTPPTPTFNKVENEPGNTQLVNDGDLITYTISYQNGNTAGTVLIADYLDEYVDFVSASNNGTNYTVPLEEDILALIGGMPNIENYNNFSSLVIWQIPNVPAYGTGEVTLTVKVDLSNEVENEDDQVDNQAAIHTSNGWNITPIPYNPLPKNPETNSDKKEITPGDGETVEFGDSITYQISYQNGDTAGTVLIADYLDEYVDFVSASNNGTNYYAPFESELIALLAGIPEIENSENFSSLVVWQIPDVPAYGSGMVTLTVKVDTTNTVVDKDNKVDNQAAIKIGNEWYETSIPVNPLESVGLGKEEIAPGNGKTVSLGDKISYNISYLNEDPEAEYIIIVDPIDPGLDFNSAYLSGLTLGEEVPTVGLNSPNTTYYGTGDYAGSSISYVKPGQSLPEMAYPTEDSEGVTINYPEDWEEDWTNASGKTGYVIWYLANPEVGSGTVGLIVTVNENAETQVDDQAMVQVGNNEGELTNIVVNPLRSQNLPIINLKKTQAVANATSSTVSVGDRVNYTVTVSNEGNAVAENVHIWDILGSGLKLNESSVTNNGKVSKTDTNQTQIDWTIASINPGQTVTLTYSAEVASIATATALGNTAYTDFDNNPDDPLTTTTTLTPSTTQNPGSGSNSSTGTGQNTGVETNAGMYITLAVVSLAALAAVVFMVNKNRKKS